MAMHQNPNARVRPSSPGWFMGAPATKLVIILVVASFFALLQKKRLLAFDASKLQTQTYRLITSKITFGSTAELVMGTSLIGLWSRQYEREMGSRTFVTMLFLINAMAIVLELILTSTIFTSITYMGPYAWLGALFWLFHRYQPRWYPRFISIMGFNLSEKSFYYLWFAQVVGNSRGAMLAASLGLLAGIVYTTSLHKLVQVPDSAAKLFHVIGERLAETPTPIVVPFQSQQRQLRPVHPVFGHGPPPGTAHEVRARQRRPPEPDPEAVEQLQMMGFETAQIREALQICNNDIQRAADRLLQQHGIS